MGGNRMNIKCPCRYIEEGEIDNCEECPYVPVYGESDTWKLKDDFKEGKNEI
jgi:hypothetical protein